MEGGRGWVGQLNLCVETINPSCRAHIYIYVLVYTGLLCIYDEVVYFVSGVVGVLYISRIKKNTPFSCEIDPKEFRSKLGFTTSCV